MSRKSTARKTQDDYFVDGIAAYKRQHSGAFRMEDAVAWCVEEGLFEEPTINPRKVLVQRVKQAARRRRFTDPQNRTVREFIAAKIERMEAGGNKILDVVWDYLHEMTLDHALIAFGQRDDGIKKQRRSATREVESCIDNNPNIRPHAKLFVFDFMLEESVEAVQEQIEESAAADHKPALPEKEKPHPR